MKKILIFLISIIVLSFFNVSACENKLQLVEDNYEYLKGIYPDFVIDVMSCEEIESVIEQNYVLTSTDEYKEYEPTRASDTHATASKMVQVNHYASGTSALVTLHALWYTIPTVRSHDILALRFNGPTYSFSTTSSYFQYSTSTTSYQSNYTSSSNNVTSASNGIGFTYKLPTNSDLNDMYFFMSTNVTGGGTIAGSYQHATSYVSKANAMNYTFSATGLGGVIKHASSSIRNKYDGMGGVSISV